MTLKEHIEDIRRRLEQKEYISEAAVRQGIIDRLLGALEWPTYDIKIVIPEYGVEGRKVDYALCNQQKKPRVFIEVKQVGNLDGAEEQLFGYAFGEGVPIAILTDGQIWRFFHATGEGKYKDRKVYELDLIESESEENIERLNRYLNYEAIQTGDAVKAIKNDYQKVSKQREIEARLPEFWNELLQDKNEYLLLAVMEKAKDKVGHEPTEEQVLAFLKSLSSKPKVQRNEDPPYSDSNHHSKTTDRTTSSTKKSQKTLIVTMPDGNVVKHHIALDTFIEVLETFGLEKVMQVYPRIVSTSPFHHGRHTMRGSYYIDHNHGGIEKKKHLEVIAKQLNVTLKVELVDK